MITWMQRHKKWLVVTLWISVIAFVGAGFVGWGSYDYSKSNSTVAKVSQREVSISDVQNEYSSLYNQYQSIYKDKFNQEVAKQLGLEKIAMNKAIQNARLMSFADELGLIVTDKEVAMVLVQTPQFQKNGKFDKNMYIKSLSQNRLNPKDYEKNLKKSILLSKTAKIFQPKATENEIKLLNSLFEAQDEVEIYIVDSKNISSKTDEKSMKVFWESNKEHYKSKASFDFDSYTVALLDKTYTSTKMKDFYTNNKNLFRDKDGKVKKFDSVKDDIIKNLKSKSTKKEALRKYIDLKKSKIKFTAKSSYDIDSLPFSSDDIAKINTSSIGKVLKPIKMLDGSYIVLKLIKKVEPQILSYNDAKVMMKNDYQNDLKRQLLSTNSKIALEQLNKNNLKTIKLGFVSRSDIDKLKDIEGLKDSDGIEFLNELFSATSETGIINLKYSSSPKAIVYKITNQKLMKESNPDAKTTKMLANAIDGMKNELIYKNLIKNLENRYETQVFRR